MTVRYRGLFFDNARWEGFLLRPGDIVVTTPAKCGTTWTQTICAFLARGRTDLGAPLDEISPWLDSQLRPVSTVHAALDAQSGRRVIKSHTPLDGLPSVPGVHYVCVGRDLRDAFASWDDHVANVDPGRLLAARSAAAGLDDLTELFPDGLPSRPAEFSARFREWVDAPLRTPTGASDLNLALALTHLTGAWERRDDPAVVLLHYEDLRSDLGAQMALVADRLGIRPDPMTWDDLVGAATFERMRERAVDFAPETTSGIWRDTGAFFRSARSGGWRSEIAATDRGCYVDRCRQLAPADLLDWIHRDGGEVAGTSGGRPAPGADRDD